MEKAFSGVVLSTEQSGSQVLFRKTEVEHAQQVSPLLIQQIPPIITLTTDFGLTDVYVGQLKGALLQGCPEATLVDITHAVPRWDVLAAAISIHTSYPFFPSGTVHLVVVDPGVGTSRHILVAEGDNHFFVCPDNGILTLLAREHKLTLVRQVPMPQERERRVSPTFHGRDIMAPVAAALAGGKDLATLGAECSPEQIVQIPLPAPQKCTDGALLGQVLSIDHFGNVRTSLHTADPCFDVRSFSALEVGHQRIERLVTTYGEVPTGALCVLVDSAGFLEIAANQANAAALLGCVPEDVITVHCVLSSISST